MPGKMKPSEATSVVPEFARKRFRDMMRREAPRDEMPARPPMDNISPEDRDALERMIRDDMQGSRPAMAKGGMVRGYAKGGMVNVRGYGKARSKPCKIC